MFSRFFVERPIFAMVLSIVIVLTGLVALVGLPIARYPEITPARSNRRHATWVPASVKRPWLPRLSRSSTGWKIRFTLIR